MLSGSTEPEKRQGEDGCNSPDERLIEPEREGTGEKQSCAHFQKATLIFPCFCSKRTFQAKAKMLERDLKENIWKLQDE